MAELLQFEHVVPVIRNENGWTSPKFRDCVIDSLDPGKKQVEVMCLLNDDKLMITTVNDSKHFNNLQKSSSSSEKFGPLFLEVSFCTEFNLHFEVRILYFQLFIYSTVRISHALILFIYFFMSAYLFNMMYYIMYV